MTHETVGLASESASVPLLHVIAAALALVESLEVEVNDDVTFSVRSLVLGAASESAEKDELERSGVGDGGEQTSSDLDVQVDLLPVGE